MRTYWVYITSSDTRVLYTGVTNNIARRMSEHESGICEGYAHRHQAVRLVYAEEFRSVREAIFREKQLKGWNRRRKLELIESINPEWKDLLRG